MHECGYRVTPYIRRKMFTLVVKQFTASVALAVFALSCVKLRGSQTGALPLIICLKGSEEKVKYV